MSKDNEMLIACRSGYLDDGGELVEIKAGVTRIAPELLARPGYEDFFERGFTAPNTNATVARYRVRMPNGRVLAG